MFFRQQNIQVFEKDAAISTPQVMDSLKIYIERIEKPINFMAFDIEIETRRRILVEQDLMQQAGMAQSQLHLEELVERQLRTQKQNQIKANQQAIREEQKEQLDLKSQPIRQYLVDNLVPVLTEGLIDVCLKQPEDPVDCLAEYLFKHSLHVECPNPCEAQMD